MTYDPSNIFAKILRGEIPCHKVYDDADALVFMDVMPQSPGHALIVPKAPSRNVLDADPAVLAKILPLVQKVAKAAQSASSKSSAPAKSRWPPATSNADLFFYPAPGSGGVNPVQRSRAQLSKVTVNSAALSYC